MSLAAGAHAEARRTMIVAEGALLRAERVDCRPVPNRGLARRREGRRGRSARVFHTGAVAVAAGGEAPAGRGSAAAASFE